MKTIHQIQMALDAAGVPRSRIARLLIALARFRGVTSTALACASRVGRCIASEWAQRTASSGLLDRSGSAREKGKRWSGLAITWTGNAQLRRLLTEEEAFALGHFCLAVAHLSDSQARALAEFHHVGTIPNNRLWELARAGMVINTSPLSRPAAYVLTTRGRAAMKTEHAANSIATGCTHE